MIRGPFSRLRLKTTAGEDPSAILWTLVNALSFLVCILEAFVTARYSLLGRMAYAVTIPIGLDAGIGASWAVYEARTEG